MTPRQRTGSALLFIPMPPLMPSAQERSSGTLTVLAQQSGQQVPVCAGATYSKGGLQSTAAHSMPVQVSTSPPAPGAYTGYATAALTIITARKHFIVVGR